MSVAFDPSRRKDVYALCESGWIELSTGWKFLFGGPTAQAKAFARCGILDAGGFTELGRGLRDRHGRGKASLLDRIPASVDRNPEGHDPVEGHGAEHESAMAKPDAQNVSQ